MKITMKDQLKDVLDILKNTVHSNIIQIKINDKKLKEMYVDLDSFQKNREMKLIREENKKLLDKNRNAIQIQLDLSNLIQKYNSVFTDITLKYEEPEYEEYFQKTINKEIDFNIRHPFFSNDKFFNELLDYFAVSEEYELCDMITKRKKYSKNSH